MEREINVFEKIPDAVEDIDKYGCFYVLKEWDTEKERMVTISKLYKSRSAAARAANKIGKAVHWYLI